MKITEQHNNAASAVIELIAAELGENRAIHSATAITSCARLAGSFLFRSFDLTAHDISPGTVVLSEQANEKGPVLINILSWMLKNLEINIDRDKVGQAGRVESSLSFVDCLNKLQHKAVVIMHEQKLSMEEMAHACAMATAFLIKECRNDLAVETSFGTSVYCFIEGSKTYPPELSDSKNQRKGFFKFWK